MTPRFLSRELKPLADLGMIGRKDHKTVPPKVEYKLTEEGQSPMPVIAVMYKWGVEHLVRDAVLKDLGIKRK